MTQFNNNYEDFIQKVITAETSALNSKKRSGNFVETLRYSKDTKS